MKRAKTVALVPLLFALPLVCLAAQAAAEATHQIEKIELQGLRWVSPRILLAESLLEEGESYTDAELRDAVYRIVRLSMVLGAEYELGPGEEGGEILVVRVRDWRKWHFGVDSDNTRWAEPISVEGLDRSEWVGVGSGSIGRHFKVGGAGLLRLALGGEEGGIELGYSHFDLFGRSAKLELAYSVGFCDRERDDDAPGEPEGACRTELVDLGLDPAFSTWTGEGDSQAGTLRLHVPIRENQSIRFEGTYRTSERGFRRSAYRPNFFDAYDYEDLRELGLRLVWSSDSTDDPIVTQRGMALEAGLEYRTLAADLVSLDFPFRLGGIPILFTEMDSRETRAVFDGARYWPVARRQTLWVKAHAALGAGRIEGVPLPGRRIVDDDLDTTEARLGVGYGLFIRRRVRKPRWRELRWETEIEGLYSGTSPDYELTYNAVSGFRVATGLVYRTTWGVFRFRIGYVDIR